MSSRDVTLAQFRLPLPLRLVNHAGEIIQCTGLSLVSLTEEGLLAAARRQTGLSDWGDRSFLVGLRLLLDDAEQHGDHNLLGKLVLRQTLVRILANRLRVEDDLERHPEILEVPIARPLFIVGLPRTGTTLLHNLLARIPGVRVPLLWELMHPSPPPSWENRESDARIGVVRRDMQLKNYMMPELGALHPMSAQTPDECFHLLNLTFSSYDLSVLASHAPRYLAWILEKDRLPDYRYYRRLLQLLAWRCTGDPWILKAPVHLPALDALCAVFPDANIVQTHRDPRKVLGSACSLTGIARSIMCRRVDMARVSRETMGFWARSTELAVDARASLPEERFHDVCYQDLVADPMGTARKIFEKFGYPLPPAAEPRMRRWLAENPQHKMGVHKYAVESFGLSREAIDQSFARYIDRFGIARE
jgi:hypothetical protein